MKTYIKPLFLIVNKGKHISEWHTLVERAQNSLYSQSICIRKIMQDKTDVRVFRSFSLPLVTFEYLKKFQREYQAKHNVVINNNQAIAALLSEHQQLNVENVEYATKSDPS